MADVRLTFDADTRAAERGVDRLARGTDELVDALEDVQPAARDAERALDDVEDAADDARDAAEDLADDLRDLEDAAPDDLGRRMGDDLEDGFRRASDGADEFKDEAQQSAREGAASFSGEFEDVADYMQEVLANALSGFGPVGAAAGLAAAAGLGILVSTLQAGEEKAEETKDRIIDLADQIREVDGDLSRLDMNAILLDWGSQISDTKRWFELWQDAPLTKVEQLATAADTLGLSLDDLVAALQDVDGPEAARVQELLEDRLGSGLGTVIASTDDATQALMTLRGELNSGSLDLERANELYELQNELLGDNADALDYAREATETYNDSVQSALEDAGASWEEYTENGITDLDAYADAMERQIESVNEYQQNMETASKLLTDEALAYLQNMGVEAAPLLQSFVDAPLEERQRIAEIWDQLGRTSVSSYSGQVSGLTDATQEAVEDASANADPVTIRWATNAQDAQKVVNSALAKVSSPIVKIRYQATNPVGVGMRRV